MPTYIFLKGFDMFYKEDSTKRLKQEIKAFNDSVMPDNSKKGLITFGVMLEMMIMKVAKLEDEMADLKKVIDKDV